MSTGTTSQFSAVGVFNELLTLILLGAVGYLIYLNHNSGPNRVTTDFVALGKEYRSDVATTCGQAWIDGSKQLAGGSKVSDALEAVNQAWTKGRTDLFTAKVAPKFSAIVPEGADEATINPIQRSALANAWEEFGKGVQGK